MNNLKNNSNLKKMKKKSEASQKSERSSTIDWYEQAGRQGYLNQETKNKKEKQETGNRIDSDSLSQLAAFKKNLETQKEEEQQVARKEAKKRAEEKEKNTHWFELAEKQGFLDYD